MSSPETGSPNPAKAKAAAGKTADAPPKRKTRAAPAAPDISTLLIRWGAVCGIVAAAIWLLFSTPSQPSSRSSRSAWAGESD